jgi:hypothetical protein
MGGNLGKEEDPIPYTMRSVLSLNNPQNNEK